MSAPVPPSPEVPTQFLWGAGKVLSRLMNGNTSKTVEVVKVAGWIIAILLFTFMVFTREGLQVTKQGAVDTTRLDHQERLMNELTLTLARDYERRDVAEIQFATLKQDVEDVKQQNIQMQKTLDQILIEARKWR